MRGRKPGKRAPKEGKRRRRGRTHPRGNSQRPFTRGLKLPKELARKIKPPKNPEGKP